MAAASAKCPSAREESAATARRASVSAPAYSESRRALLTLSGIISPSSIMAMAPRQLAS